MVYGDTLQVPGDFFNHQRLQTPDAIRQEVEQFIPCRPTYRDRKQRYVPDDLDHCSHVFVRVDQQKPPLTPPYVGPFKLILRKSKSYKLDVKGRATWVSIDRQKPAYLATADEPPITFSSAGRLIRKISS